MYFALLIKFLILDFERGLSKPPNSTVPTTLNPCSIGVIPNPLFEKITEKDRELDLKTFEIPYDERDHALYVAYGPYKNPRYALSVIVEHGGSGSATAAPMAKKLFKLIIDRHQTRQSVHDKKYLEI